LPALRSFCMYCAIGMLYVYFLQTTFFVGCMVLDQVNRCNKVESQVGKQGCFEDGIQQRLNKSLAEDTGLKLHLIYVVISRGIKNVKRKVQDAVAALSHES
jgi:hypothetical protein